MVGPPVVGGEQAGGVVHDRGARDDQRRVKISKSNVEAGVNWATAAPYPRPFPPVISAPKLRFVCCVPRERENDRLQVAIDQFPSLGMQNEVLHSEGREKDRFYEGQHYLLC